MSIKPWLSKNFLQMMQWSNVRDYPPKRKKPWLFDNFMEMEEIHSDHMEETFKLPNDPPLPPDPDIPQDPEDVEEDPCLGDRNLWVIANPSSIDCDSGEGLNLIISPDFRCIEITQAFADGSSPSLQEDAGGNLRIEKGCDDDSMMTLWVCDCLCGGCSSVTIFLENCDIDCDSVFVSGSNTIGSNDTEQYSLEGFPPGAGDIMWAVAGEGASIDETGLVTTSNSCGTIDVSATTDCCGDKFKEVKAALGLWVLVDHFQDQGVHESCNCISGCVNYICHDPSHQPVDGVRYSKYDGGQHCRRNCPDSGNTHERPEVAPCTTTSPRACSNSSCPDEEDPVDCVPVDYIREQWDYEWECAP